MRVQVSVLLTYNVFFCACNVHRLQHKVFKGSVSCRSRTPRYVLLYWLIVVYGILKTIFSGTKSILLLLFGFFNSLALLFDKKCRLEYKNKRVKLIVRCASQLSRSARLLQWIFFHHVFAHCALPKEEWYLRKGLFLFLRLFKDATIPNKGNQYRKHGNSVLIYENNFTKANTNNV